MRTGGGGGWGDPLERDPAAVRADVQEEFISPTSAREDYGVVLRDDLSIDQAATERAQDCDKIGTRERAARGEGMIGRDYAGLALAPARFAVTVLAACSVRSLSPLRGEGWGEGVICPIS